MTYRNLRPPLLPPLAWRPHAVHVATVITSETMTVRRGQCVVCLALVEVVARHDAAGNITEVLPAAPSECPLVTGEST